MHSSVINGESLNWDIDNVVAGGPVGSFVSPLSSTTITSSVGGPFDFVVYSGGNSAIEFQRTYQISATDIANITVDGTVNIFVDLGPSVDGGDFVGVELTFQTVPEPSSTMMLAICLGALITTRNRTRLDN